MEDTAKQPIVCDPSDADTTECEIDTARAQHKLHERIGARLRERNDEDLWRLP